MRLQLDARARRWLRRLPVVNLYSVAELALMAVLAGQAARLLWAIVTPVSPLGEWRPAPVVTPASPVETLTSFDPFFRLSAPAELAGPVAVTPLQLTLFGTRIDDATGGGSAIVAGPDGVQKSISVGEEVAPGVKLAAVAFDHVTLDRGASREELYLDQSAQPASALAGSTGLAGVGGASLGPAGPVGVTVTQLRQDIGFIPRIDAGRLSGLVVRSQGTGEAFRQIGLRDNDVLTSVAGRQVTGADALDSLGTQYPQGGNVPITVERGGQPVSLSITIAPAS